MHTYVVVDAFAHQPLLGNPVAVFFGSDDLSPRTMQRIAREMNLSETTFVLRPRHGGDARIRIFTPVNELPFAGHPLLGTAIALGARGPGDRLRLETAMGIVPFDLTRKQGRVVAARMRQPVPTWRPFARAEELLTALGVQKSTLPVEIYHNGPRHVLVGLESVAALSALRPDHRALAAFEDLAANCFAPDPGGETRRPAPDEEGASSWRTRMFSPAYGVTEDAATGSAAGPLAVHLARHGMAPYGRQIRITQGVEMGRPSLMLARAEGTVEAAGSPASVDVGGAGVLVAEGSLHV
ncbi:PhzF family phenazine biosynthesis protein [Streptomyces sp. WMMB303]|uniref:PhzF family phenazine biosynthesis protein n=1 Tax=Streptomyces sp. WMMB303 TaxID=3034154 RepID=UPI0023EB92B1|nr:PhzF family phenazine biosynthesis protein [Streptomyces sp. WMMB303]MDF4249055.1 PhzF family phenazine biosynthesis protein [Streptomyces sp. WMMB303]